jgi:hypothetical protein
MADRIRSLSNGVWDPSRRRMRAGRRATWVAVTDMGILVVTLVQTQYLVVYISH